MDDKELRRELKMYSRSAKKTNSKRGKVQRGGGYSPQWMFRNVKDRAKNRLVKNAGVKLIVADFKPIDCYRDQVNTKSTARCKGC
jgi:hypothetical protein